MTNPPHGHNADDNSNNKENPDGGGSQQQPFYPPSNHPEDRPEFGYQGSEQTAYGAYSNPGESSAQHNGHVSMQQEPGKINILEAISWGFATTFRNAKLWIVLGLIVFIGIIAAVAAQIAVIASIADPGTLEETGGELFSGTVSDVLTLGIVLITLVLTPYFYRLALFQVDDANTGWGHLWKDTPLLRAIGVMLAVSIVSGILYFVAVSPLGQAFSDGTPESNSFSASGIAMMLIGTVAMVAWSVLSMFMSWAAVSGQFGFGASMKTGWGIGWTNFAKLLLFAIVANLVVTVALLISFGLVLIVVVPAWLLVTAHMFRQAVPSAA